MPLPAQYPQSSALTKLRHSPILLQHSENTTVTLVALCNIGC